jgi:hypothetical protein
MERSENRPVVLVFERRADFVSWCDVWGGPGESGGFRLYLRVDHPILQALRSTPMSGQRSLIAFYWYGARDTEGDPLPGILAMWSALPHELGHHVHALLLDHHVPPFQSDGFTTYHEFPVDFAGRIEFGDFQNPTNRRYLDLVHAGGAIDLPEFIPMSYEEISGGGTSDRGYASAWLYYQFLRRHDPDRLARFETAVAAADPERRDLRALFLEVFDLDGEEGLAALGQAARDWAAGQNITLESASRVLRAIEAVERKLPLSYTYRMRAPAVAPD